DAEKIQIKEGTGSDPGVGILWDGCPVIANGGTYAITSAGGDGYYTIRMIDIYGNAYGLPVRITEFDTPAAPAIRVYKSGTTVVSGTAVAGSTVKVVVGSKSYSATADSKGAWSVKTASLKVGTVIKANVTSQFGKVSGTTSVRVKNQQLKKPSVKKAKKNTKKVIGTAKAKTTVYVKIGKKTYKAKVNAKGKFTVKTKKLKKNTKLTLYIKDAAGNTSKKVSYKVK
ncbi:MAG: Ig-like domain-containing protein, partial [Eubacteriales bacterium]|nr:Ig-like domain-containing protein [Eubacteriales bacterium]